ncbi:MAG: hypothetical protein ACKVZH_14445 [Blastocatellia bacterium]
MLLLVADVARAQEDTTPKKRLRSPATANGFIGGESHDSYVIRAEKGQAMTVQIWWRRKKNNQAGFTVSKSANFFTGDQVTFGKSSDKGRRWSGRIPRTGNYYIYVLAHPTAHYTLSVTVE